MASCSARPCRLRRPQTALRLRRLAGLWMRRCRRPPTWRQRGIPAPARAATRSRALGRRARAAASGRAPPAWTSALGRGKSVSSALRDAPAAAAHGQQLHGRTAQQDAAPAEAARAPRAPQRPPQLWRCRSVAHSPPRRCAAGAAPRRAAARRRAAWPAARKRKTACKGQSHTALALSALAAARATHEAALQAREMHAQPKTRGGAQRLVPLLPRHQLPRTSSLLPARQGPREHIARRSVRRIRYTRMQRERMAVRRAQRAAGGGGPWSDTTTSASPRCHTRCASRRGAMTIPGASLASPAAT